MEFLGILLHCYIEFLGIILCCYKEVLRNITLFLYRSAKVYYCGNIP